MTEGESDPLSDLYEDGSQFNRERLSEALDGKIGVDQDNGEPIFKQGYKELSNKQKFVCQLLYRKVGVELGEINPDEVGITSKEAAKNLTVSDSAVTNYKGQLDFVERDADIGGYLIPGHAIENAIDYISD